MINTTVVSNTIQPYYNRKLLEHAVQLTKLVDYAQQEELPPAIGATTMRFFRPPQADLTQTGAPATLTEGTPISTFRDIAYTNIDVALTQIGQAAKVTDIANTVGLVKFLDTAITLMGEEFALDYDTRLRNLICNASTGLTKRYAQGTGNFTTLQAASAANGALLPQDLLFAVAKLKLNRAPTFGGYYVAIIPPQIATDIINNSVWREVIRNQYAEKAFKGEIGEFYQCKIVEATNPFIEGATHGEGTYDNTGNVLTTYVLGKGSYGTVNMKKMGASPNKASIIINDKPDKSDPLGQFITAGWKAFYAGAILNAAWGIALRSQTQFS